MTKISAFDIDYSSTNRHRISGSVTHKYTCFPYLYRNTIMLAIDDLKDFVITGGSEFSISFDFIHVASE